jgi:frataxin-like iron-binding protein CyaY
MDYGIQIYLPQLNTLSIAEDGQSVTVGGGINSKALTDGLWAAGKQTGELVKVESCDRQWLTSTSDRNL